MKRYRVELELKPVLIEVFANGEDEAIETAFDVLYKGDFVDDLKIKDIFVEEIKDTEKR